MKNLHIATQEDEDEDGTGSAVQRRGHLCPAAADRVPHVRARCEAAR